MCTLSWLYKKDGVHIFFNRDEAKTRPQALLPAIYSNPTKHKYIMPTDAQAYGSWIGVTEAGIGLCLLNFYQGKTPHGVLISRGLLVKALLEIASKQDMLNYLHTRIWSQYAPFTLVLFFPDEKQPSTFCWDGESFNSVQINSPYTSSGVDFPEVSRVRQDTFSKYFALKMADSEQIKIEKIRLFHASHEPERSKYSVCMHRSDANTVSFSEINITSQSVYFDYTNGPPCCTSKAPSVSLVRQ